MRLPRQAMVEVRNSRNWVQGAQGLRYKRVLHACLILALGCSGTRDLWRGSDKIRRPSSRATLLLLQFPYQQQTLVRRSLCVQFSRTLLVVAFGIGSPRFRKFRKKTAQRCHTVLFPVLYGNLSLLPGSFRSII